MVRILVSKTNDIGSTPIAPVLTPANYLLLDDSDLIVTTSWVKGLESSHFRFQPSFHCYNSPTNFCYRCITPPGVTFPLIYGR